MCGVPICEAVAVQSLRSFKHWSLAATVLVFVALYGFAAAKYEGFFTLRVLVKLGGMFFARGMAFVVSQESVEIAHPFYSALQGFGIPLSERVSVPATALVFLMVFAVGVFLAHYTRFGMNVYALGGSESSAR